MITIPFGIPSFITTLGMLFMLRSLCVVLYSQGGSRRRACRTIAPVWAFSAPLGVIGVSVPSGSPRLASSSIYCSERSNFGNWIRATGGSLGLGEGGGHSNFDSKDRLLHHLFAVRWRRRA